MHSVIRAIVISLRVSGVHWGCQRPFILHLFCIFSPFTLHSFCIFSPFMATSTRVVDRRHVHKKITEWRPIQYSHHISPSPIISQVADTSIRCRPPMHTHSYSSSKLSYMYSSHVHTCTRARRGLASTDVIGANAC